MDSLPSPTALEYERVVPPYVEFLRRHRGRRTTRQVEDALVRFLWWAATRDRPVTAVRDLTPGALRDYLTSFDGKRRGTIAVHASALRGWLGYLHFQGLIDVDLAIWRQRSCSPVSRSGRRCLRSSTSAR